MSVVIPLPFSLLLLTTEASTTVRLLLVSGLHLLGLVVMSAAMLVQQAREASPLNSLSTSPVNERDA